MKSLLIVLTILLIGFVAAGQEPQQPVVEKVQVNWWQVPVFATDKAGKPVRYLEAKDLEVTVNGHVVSEFDLQKRSFTMAEQQYSGAPPGPSPDKPPLAKERVLVLLFDVAMSGQLFTQRAKNVAKKIVLEAEENTRFIVMTIEPFAGLNLIGQAGASVVNKGELLRMIKNNVVQKENSRSIRPNSLLQQAFGMQRWVSGRSTAAQDLYRRKSSIFFQAFETLYFYLNSIEENKVVYLFSEGISNSALENMSGASSQYTQYLEKTAKTLGRCGAVLFLINTMGVDQYTSSNMTSSIESGDVPTSLSPLSGESSLKYLARASGGSYLEGVEDQIVERIENMNLAYYEISFPDIPGIQGSSREISIKAKQPGIILHSLRSLEKRKDYLAMSDVEKDMLALNLVTVNPLVESKLETFNVKVDKVGDSKKKVVYHIRVPAVYIGKTIDIFKFWVLDDREVLKAQKESLVPKEKKLEIEFELESLASKGKESGQAKIKTYFVLIDGTVNTARVQGMDWYEEDPEFPAAEETIIAQKPSAEKTAEKTVNSEELDKILQGAADYCDRLKQSAFHFYCREKILETRQPLTEAEKEDPDISYEAMRKGTVRAMDEMRTKVYTQVKHYLFGYRLIKLGNKINEERDYISSMDNVTVTRDQVVKTNAFFSEKAIFAPITLLDRSRQDKYDYRFIHDDELHGRRAAVIAAVPKDPVETASIYGKIWIDREDFSVLKIEADPTSIRGYKALKELSKKLRTKLYLSLETEFNQIREGIRFPTKVSMLEKYKGGRIISDFRGPQGWERTRTEFTYNDYQFFNVQTDVTVH